MSHEAVTRLSRDLAASEMSHNAARLLTDYYYMKQDDRKRLNNQVLALTESGEPCEAIKHLAEQEATLEKQAGRALDKHSATHPVGAWARSIVGIGPIMAAGLIAHFDIRKAPTAGHFWNFAGLNPGIIAMNSEKAKAWIKAKQKEGGHSLDECLLIACEELSRTPATLRRYAMEDKEGNARNMTVDNLAAAIARWPYNKRLKTLCWKVGESFVKVSNNDRDFYGKVYVANKLKETSRNDAGELAKQAEDKLANNKIGKTTEAYGHYSSGKLPPAHIHARAKRAAVKLFLSHLHEVWFEIEYGHKPPRPYALEHLGHAHQIAPPNWPME